MKKTLGIVFALLLMLVCATAFAAGELSFGNGPVTLFVGETVQLDLIRQNAALEEGTLTYKSNYPKIASVDENGLVTAVGKGNANITATLKTGKATMNATIAVKVQKPVTSLEVHTSKLTVYETPDDPALDGLLAPAEEPEENSEEESDPEAEAEPEPVLPVLVLSVGTNVNIGATLLPADASNRKYQIVTDDEEEKVVKVINAGTGLKPVAPGECVITVESVLNPEVNQAFHVLVTQPVKKITLACNAEKATIDVGETTQIIPSFTPDNVTITALTWSSNSEKIAKVDANGVVTGVSKGSATITAKAVDGSKQAASIRINVAQQPSGIKLDPENPTIAVGTYRNMKATVLPANTNDKAVTWTSSDPTVAAVAANGRITPVAPGECTITCTCTNYPEIYAETIVSVIQPAKKIEFLQKQTSVIVGESTFVGHTILPEDTTDTSVTYKSNNPRVASVDEEGNITGIKAGKATITVTTADGSRKAANLTVVVIQPVEGVHMKNDSVTVGVDESIHLTAVLEPSDASNTAMYWESSDPYIAKVSGKTPRPVVVGKAWGDVVITGTTEDGGFTTTCNVKVGNFDKALEISDLYVDNQNKIRVVVTNVSNMNITRFWLKIDVYDLFGNPLPCTTTGNNEFEATYTEVLDAGMSTRHNRFTFYSFSQPWEIIGRVVVHVTGYQTDEGFSRNIREDKQPMADYMDKYYNPGGEIEPSDK